MKCRHKNKTWWLCSGCGNLGCNGCFAFKLPTVDFCVNCYRDYIKKKKLYSLKSFDSHLNKNFVEVGDIVYKLAKSSFNVCFYENRKEV